MTVAVDQPVAAGPISQTIRRRVRERIDRMGWHDREVAARLGMSASNFSRLISGEVRLSAEVLDQLVAALEVSYDWLLELQVDKHDAVGAWNARFGHPQELFEKFGEHQRRSNEITSFDRHIVCSQMPKGPHDKRYEALFSEMLWLDEADIMLKSFIAFADMRRNRYLERFSDQCTP